MNWADWALLAILLISCLISVKRGFVKEALSLAVWVLAFVIAVLFSGHLSTFLQDAISTPSLRQIVAFASLFVATLIVGALVNYLLGELVKITGLSGTDRLLGMLFGLARGVVIVMAILILLPQIVSSITSDSWWQQSVIIPHFLAFEDWARQTASSVSDFFMSFFE